MGPSSVKGDEATGSGLVRDSRGDFVVGYAFKRSYQDVLQAELEAIIHGLVLCIDRGLKPEVEIDSAMAFNMITRRTIEAWKYEFLVRRVRRLLTGFNGLKLVYREQNGVADSLAKWAHGLDTDNYFLIE